MVDMNDYGSGTQVSKCYEKLRAMIVINDSGL